MLLFFGRPFAPDWLTVHRFLQPSCGEVTNLYGRILDLLAVGVEKGNELNSGQLARWCHSIKNQKHIPGKKPDRWAMEPRLAAAARRATRLHPTSRREIAAIRHLR